MSQYLLGRGTLSVLDPDGTEHKLGTVSHVRVSDKPLLCDPLRNGAHKRFFWRVRHRIGPGWWKYSDREIRKLLRQMSWRRPL